MMIKQISVILENESGRLLNVTDILKTADVNISALFIAKTEEYGILRMIVSDTEKAEEVLRSNNYSVNITDVTYLITPDEPGMLNEKLKLLASAGINVAYMYGYSSDGNARLFLKTDDPKRTAEVLA